MKKLMLLILIVCLPLFSCLNTGGNNTVGGGGGGGGGGTSSDQNGSGSEIIGKTVYKNRVGDQKSSNPVINGEIFLFKSDFEPNYKEVYKPIVFTDDKGNFIIEDIEEPGEYIIEVNDGNGQSLAMRFQYDGKKTDLGTLEIEESASLIFKIIPKLKRDFFEYQLMLKGTRICFGGSDLSETLNDIPTGVSYSIKGEILKPKNLSFSKTWDDITFEAGELKEKVFKLFD